MTAMPKTLENLIAAWDGLGVVCRFDAPTGTWMFICLHDNTLGSCTGGSRMRVYPSPAEGLEDAMRLAEGMTSKWAAIDEPVGGGKAVLAVPEPLSGEARTSLLRRYGALIESLGGTFRTGEDLGTTSEDMKILSEVTRFVHGFHPEGGTKVDPSPFTARGVYAGLMAAAASRWGSDDLRERSVLIEGTGNVGLNLGRLLAAAGAKLLVSDIDDERARQAASELSAEVVAVADVSSCACDIYAPCAIGATLSESTIPKLRCAVVAGSANNQLATAFDANRLHEQGILYVPDYIINAGGALSFALMDRGVSDRDQILAAMDTIGETVHEILVEAMENDESPVVAAQRRVDERLARGRQPAQSSVPG